MEPEIIEGWTIEHGDEEWQARSPGGGAFLWCSRGGDRLAISAPVPIGVPFPVIGRLVELRSAAIEQLRSAIGPTAFDEIYGVDDGD